MASRCAGNGEDIVEGHGDIGDRDLRHRAPEACGPNGEFVGSHRCSTDVGKLAVRVGAWLKDAISGTEPV